MFKVYGFPGTRATRVTWMLEEIGADYEYIKVNLQKGEALQPPYLDVNPGGKVPTLIDGDLVLTESVAICTYLGDKFPESKLVPAAGTDGRALFLQWSCFAISELEQPLWTITKHTFALPENKRVPAILETAAWEFQRPAKVLAKALDARDYILGAEFTAADIILGHTLGWARFVKMDLGDSQLNAYADRVLGRPALAKARAREQQS